MDAGRVLAHVADGANQGEQHATLLERALQASEMRLGVTVRSVGQDSSGVTAVLSDGSEARADIVVGADGVDSVVRRQLYPDTRSHYAGFSAWRAVIQTEGPPPGLQGETIGSDSCSGSSRSDGSGSTGMRPPAFPSTGDTKADRIETS